MKTGVSGLHFLLLGSCTMMLKQYGRGQWCNEEFWVASSLGYLMNAMGHSA